MTFLHTIIMGIVEGVTEFLPISSTAHLDITRTLLHIADSDFIKSFEIVIQLGAILAVVLLYWKKVFTSWTYFRNIAIAFIPTGIIGFLLYKLIKSYLLGNIMLSASMLIIGGILIIFFEYREREAELHKVDNIFHKNVEQLSVKDLLLIGTAQALAVVPGVSRSLAVILSGRARGLSRAAVVEFSFLLAIPTMLAATSYDLYKSGFAFTGGEWGTIALGFIVSFIVALAVVKWLLGYIKKHSFVIFGWYRIIAGVLILLFLL
ncbi:MAG: undecaprenyl-diphosphatase UppP [bacterium]